jgi:hypothetical protein
MRKKKSERGATILESLMCILLLCLIFFGLMQIFQWSMAQMLTEYSSFYAAKAYSLGYTRKIVIRASRVAITGASGQDISAEPTIIPPNASSEERQRILSIPAKEYMMYGQYGPRNINFEYWDPDNITSDTPIVEVYPLDSPDARIIYGRVKIKNMPLLAENLSWFVGGATEANPVGETAAFNHSTLFLENR